MRAYRRLKEHLGIQTEDKYLYDWPELGAADPDESILHILGSDARGVHDRFPQEIYIRNRNRPSGTPYYDDWGVGQPEIAPGEYFPRIHPLKEGETLEALKRYLHWPNMDDPTRTAHVGHQARRLVGENHYAIFGAPWLLFPFERACQLQGLDVFLMNMVSRPDFAQALLEKILSLCKTHMGYFLEALDENLDVIAIGDDLGTQESLLMSPQMYRQILKPIHADWIAFIKARTKAKVFFHSDGDITPLLDDLVEIGVDILNPIQTSAGEMADLARLKKRYGRHLCFCGAIDTQRVLPHGTPDQVREEVRRVIGCLGPGGGYMVASVHSIMNDVPPENILAMAEAVEAFGTYPLST
jgi:uroporphyrinogen decarboxylase